MCVIVPVVLGSANARVGFPAAIAALRAGRSAMDAAVAAVRCVEDNPEDHGVGTGGGNEVEDQYQFMRIARDWAKLLHKEITGTTNVIARDLQGNIACAVSTSGWGFKWPGRVGDSPIIGAGNYADNRYGAAACTGRGEMAIRAATAYSIVRYMRDGLSLDEALRRAMLDLRDIVDPFAERVNVMNAVAMDRDGTVGAISTAADTFYVFQTLDMSDPEERPRAWVPHKGPG